MSRKSDNFPLVLTGGALALWLLLHKIFDIFFEDWIKHQLEPFVGHTVAEMIERFGSAGFPALAAGGIVWFLYSYIKSHLRAQLPDPMVEAQREQTAAILAHTEAIKLSGSFTKDGPAEIPVPNLRVADLPAVLALFEDREQDKTVPLLEGGHLSAWARRMDSGEPPLNRLEAAVWSGHHLEFLPKRGGQSKNQTFIKRNGRNETPVYYDLFLCLEQIQKVWPSLRIGIVAPDPSDIWKAAPEAMEAFAERDLIALRDKQSELFHEGYMKAHEAEDEIREIQNKFANWRSLDTTTLEGRTLRANQRRLEVYNMQTAHAKDGLRRAWDALRVDIESKLTRGYLIAKGFRCPHVVGSAETEISMAEWRILDLNNVTSEAIKKGSDDILYSGIVLRRSD